MSRWDIEDRSGNWLLGFQQKDALCRFLRWQLANGNDLTAITVWHTDTNCDLEPLDPLALAEETL